MAMPCLGHFNARNDFYNESEWNEPVRLETTTTIPNHSLQVSCLGDCEEEYSPLPSSATASASDKVHLVDSIRWKDFTVLMFVWVSFLAIQTVKTYAVTCSVEYWILNSLQVPIAVCVSLYEAISLYKGKRGIESIGKDITNWKVHQLLFYCICGIIAGIVGGLLGLGGGFILGPLFLELGVPPQVASATSTFAMAFSSSMSVIQYYLLKRFPVPYAGYFVLVATIAAFTGQHIVRKLIMLLGRASLIIFILALIIFVSAISLGGEGIANVVEKVGKNEYMGNPSGIRPSSFSFIFGRHRFYSKVRRVYLESMAKKRQIEDDNIIHAKKPKHLTLHKDDSSTYLLSKDEQKLFLLSRWFQLKLYRRIRPPEDIARIKDYYTCALSLIREAYCSIRGNGNKDIVKVLKDKVAFRALIDFATCFRRMKQFSLCMNALRTDLSMKLKIDGTTTVCVSSDKPGPSSELDRSLKGKCPDCSLIHAQVSLMPYARPRVLELSGNSKIILSSLEHTRRDNQFSIKVYNMLLILNTILTQMEIQSEDDEGYGHAELTEMIQRRMNVLRTEMEQEETLLIGMINSECKSECISACDELRCICMAAYLEVGIGGDDLVAVASSPGIGGDDLVELAIFSLN
ncbi:Sulfite exporter TauE/SafE family protein [Thalictrum thalictroides]|uniref:Sulfite exporter TauE/SafE family protein n=1 Tax=Thalictrum thalictroides TaxID=46969 RepID=A0A7J6VC64_THATH|nr:Sulfite exporter TauE/SafE family protein [Thalictrum thalictroides]